MVQRGKLMNVSPACCRGEHVPVLGIASHLFDEVVEAVDQRLRAQGRPHQANPAARLLGRYITLGRFLCTLGCRLVDGGWATP